MVKKQRITFTGSDQEIKLKKDRVDICIKILNSKDKQEERRLQEELMEVTTQLNKLRIGGN